MDKITCISCYKKQINYTISQSKGYKSVYLSCSNCRINGNLKLPNYIPDNQFPQYYRVKICKNSKVSDIKRCILCGCPQINKFDGYYPGDPTHYQDCPILETDRYKWANKKNYNIKDRLKDKIEIKIKEVKDIKAQIRELEDIFKNTVMDEVYECRWDCHTVPG